MLELEPAVGEDSEIGDALDTVTGSEIGVAFGIDLEDDGAAGELAGGLGDVGRSHAAGSAPGGPEIDEDRDFALADNLIEFGGVDFYRLGD